MANATTTTPGSIVLGGDLTGTATSPALRPTGVVAGSHYPYKIWIDSKGRLLKCSTDLSEITNVISELDHASDTTVGIVKTATGAFKGLFDNTSGLISAPVATSSTYGVIKTSDYIEIDGSNVINLHIPYSTTTSKGIMQVGDAINVTSGSISVSDATTSTLGILKVTTGNLLNLSSGELSKSANSISDATTSTHGILKVTEGNGLTLTTGTLSYIPTIPNATAFVKGQVQVGTNIDIDTGVISIKTASYSDLGIAAFDPDYFDISGTGIASRPVASTSVKGVLTVDATSVTNGLVLVDGDLSYSAPAIQDAQSLQKGIVQVTEGNGLAISSGSISYTPIDATSIDKGEIQVGTNINVNSGEISVATATTNEFGVVSIGDGLDITAGTLSLPTLPTLTNATYTVPGGLTVNSQFHITTGSIFINPATTSVKGPIILGTNLENDPDDNSVIRISYADPISMGVVQVTEGNGLSLSAGTLSYVSSGLPTATVSNAGLVQIGTGLDIGSEILSILDGSTSVKGKLSVGTNLNYGSGIVSVSEAGSSVKGILKVTEGNGLTLTSGTLAYSYPEATTTSKGVVQIGSGIDVTSAVASVTTASSTVLGGVKIGNSLIYSNGVVDVATESISLSDTNTYTKAMTQTLFSHSTSGTKYLTPSSNGNNQIVTFTGNTIVKNQDNSALVAGAVIKMYVKQDSVGGRTISFESRYKTNQTITLSTEPGAIDLLTFIVKSGTEIFVIFTPGWI